MISAELMEFAEVCIHDFIFHIVHLVQYIICHCIHMYAQCVIWNLQLCVLRVTCDHTHHYIYTTVHVYIYMYCTCSRHLLLLAVNTMQLYLYVTIYTVHILTV